VLKFLSVNNIVIEPANTGKDKINKKAVIKTAQTKRGNLCIVIPGALILKIVVIKFTVPKIEDVPAKCKLNIAKSTEPPEWKPMLDNGGYTVQPVPAPPSTKLELNNKINEGGNNQKLILFKRGKAISALPIIKGTNQLPNPPIKTGITRKNIIKKA
jgi:hypothetical protein